MKLLLVFLILLLTIDLWITKTELHKTELTLISCFQHGAMYVDKSMHLCRPANVWITKED